MPEPECIGAANDAIDLLAAPGDSAIASIAVRAFGCQVEGCPPGFAARGGGEVWIEYARGGGLDVLEVAVAPDGSRSLDPVDRGPAFVVRPESAPAQGSEAPLTLGHCGLLSPIDFDASLWDPVGQVDGDAPETINAATGTIVALAGGAQAEFRAPSGYRVTLVRHDGPKSLPGCD